MTPSLIRSYVILVLDFRVCYFYLMKKPLLLTGAVLILAGCIPQYKPQVESPTLESLLENPLFAERYAEEIVERMVNLEIMEDPILEDGSKKDKIDKIMLSEPRDKRIEDQIENEIGPPKK